MFNQTDLVVHTQECVSTLVKINLLFHFSRLTLANLYSEPESYTLYTDTFFRSWHPRSTTTGTLRCSFAESTNYYQLSSVK